MTTTRFREQNMLQTILPSVEFSEIKMRLTCSDSSPMSWYTVNSALPMGGKTFGKYKSIRDSVVPGFRRKSKEGQVFMNPLEVFSCTADFGSGPSFFSEVALTDTWPCPSTGKYFPEVRTNIVDGRINLGSMIPGMDGCKTYPQRVSQSKVNDLVAEAVTECRARRGTSQGINLFETGAELHKTLQLHTDLLKNAAGVIAGKRSLFRRAQELSSGYLALRYGLMPIIRDIQAITKELGRSRSERIRSTSRGFASLSETFHDHQVIALGSQFTADVQYTTVENVSIRAMSLDEHAADFFWKYGLTSKDFLRTPWELIKYSFVIDWFVNLGDFYASILPTFGFNQLGSCTVLQYDQVRNATASVVAKQGYSLTSGGSGSTTFSATCKRRVAGLSGPSVTLKSNFGFEDIARATDAVALVIQRLRFP